MRLVDVVFRNLSRRKGRMILIATGLAIGVGTVVALRSLTATIEQEIGAQLDQYGANIVIVPKTTNQDISYGGISLSSTTFDVHKLRTEDLSRIRSIPYANRLSIIAPKLLGAIRAENNDFLLAGITFSEELKMKKWWQVSGRVPAEPMELLLGFEVARRLGVIESPPAEAAGSSHRHAPAGKIDLRLLRSDLTLGLKQFRIAGVLLETGAQDDRMIFAQLATAQQVLQKPGELSLIEVSALCNGCPIDDIVAQIGAALPEAKVSALQQAVRARLQTVERLSRFSTALSIVMLFIGFLLVFVTMTASVVERTREIGVLRALGFRRIHVIKIFVIEAIIVSAIGGVVGWAGGTIAGILSSRQLTETGTGAHPSLTLALAAFAAAVMVGVMSSLYPAIKASKLDPTESLRYF